VAGGEERTGTVNPAALTLGVATLIGVLGTITVTGTIGRVFRNYSDELGTSIVLLLIAGAFLAAAGLPATGGFGERVCSFAGIGLTLVGLLVGVRAGTDSVDDVERPAIAAQLVDDGLRLKGSVNVADLPSQARLVLRVDGLRLAPNGDVVEDARIHQAFAGPDSDGKIKLPMDVRVPAGTYDEVKVRAWTSDEDAPVSGVTHLHPCREHPQERDDQPSNGEVGTGCVRLPLPPVAVSPRLTMQWTGAGQNERRLRILVASDNAPSPHYKRKGCESTTGAANCPPTDRAGARVAIRVTGKRRAGKLTLLYRALLNPDGRGDLKEVLLVPVRRRLGRVCADAFFVVGAGSFPKRKCPVAAARRGHATVQLRPVGGRKPGT
jgi:hypothetical protein